MEVYHYHRLPRRPLEVCWQCAGVTPTLALAWEAGVAVIDTTIEMRNEEPCCKYGCSVADM